MNKKIIAKKVIYYSASAASAILPVRKTKALDRETNLRRLGEIAPDHPIYSEKTFEDCPLPIKVDLCLVIPFYCVKQSYLEECLNSLLNQDTKCKYKIICIDDGSTDDTLSRLQKFAGKYPEKIYVYHQENGGISCARNKGIQLSNAEYIGFIDQDDWVEKNYIDRLLKTARKYDADIVKCSHKVVCDGEVLSVFSVPTDVIDGTVDEKILSYSGMIWSGIYKTDILRKIRFPEKYWYEDMIARNLLYRSAPRFASINDVLYVKRKHDSNASSILWNGKSTKCFDHLYLFKHILEENEKLGLKDNVVLQKSVLTEMGQYLMWRTRGQRRYARKLAFTEACYIVRDNMANQICLNDIERCYLKNYLDHDYLGWLLTSWRDWAVTE